MNQLTVRQISPKIQSDWRRLQARQETVWKDWLTGWWIKSHKDRFPRRSKLTEEEYRKDKRLSGKTDYTADESKAKRTDFPENPNLLKTTIGNKRHCLWRLIIKLTLNKHSNQLWPKTREKFNFEIMMKFLEWFINDAQNQQQNYIQCIAD